LLQEIKHSVKRAATSSQFQQYACIPDHYFMELALIGVELSAQGSQISE
jgi:hypothetical protein